MENKRPISIWTCQTGELQEERGTHAAPRASPLPSTRWTHVPTAAGCPSWRAAVLKHRKGPLSGGCALTPGPRRALAAGELLQGPVSRE